MSTILILDDQSISRMILEELVRSIGSGVRAHSFADPLIALEWTKENECDLVLTDYMMPNMNGIEFTRWLREIPAYSDVPVVIITSAEDKTIRYQALEAGATDFLNKPIDHNECRARCRNLLQLRKQQLEIKGRAATLAEEVKAKTRDIELREKETLLRLARAGEYRDEDTGNHVMRMAEYSTLIAVQLGVPPDQCEIIRHASPMHDIGKIGIPDQILRKPGKLQPAEWEVMQQHCRIGFEILKDSPSFYLKTGAVIALRHHERFDGLGYPDGLSKREIPLEARIVAVADVYDALVSERPYKKSWSTQQALDYMRGQRGKHFDPDCVDAFLARMEDVAAIQAKYADT